MSLERGILRHVMLASDPSFGLCCLYRPPTKTPVDLQCLIPPPNNDPPGPSSQYSTVIYNVDD